MDSQLLKRAVEFAANVGYVIVATSDANGIPHIATAGKLEYDAQRDLIEVSEWFCTTTVANLHVNRHISIAAWEPKTDKGFQLRGMVTEVQNTAVLNGYTERETREHFPQTRHTLLIKVDKVAEFSHTVHSDENLVNM